MNLKTEYVSLEKKAIYVATECAEFIRSSIGENNYSGKIVTKSTATDPVTEIDRGSELLARKLIAELNPSYKVRGEEFGVDTKQAEVEWIIDPIDGTVNFIYGIPAYAVSVGVCYRGKVVAGAVINVCTGEIYSAALGNGAYLERQSVKGVKNRLEIANKPINLSSALIGTGFAYNADTRTIQAKILQNVLPRVRDIRRIGSAALDLCMVAAGRLDGYYEHGLGTWDFAAGLLIAQEAGAEITAAPIGSGYDDKLLTMATTPSIHADLLGVLGISGNSAKL